MQTKRKRTETVSETATIVIVKKLPLRSEPAGVRNAMQKFFGSHKTH
jgi:hypothetical protein